MSFQINNITPNQVHETLSRHMLVDGFPLVVNLGTSHGSWMVDAKTGKKYLDFFSYFASDALGHNHPTFFREDVERKLLTAARNKVANSDVYSTLMAEFVDTLSRTAGVPELPYYFFIDGGALAVENAMKTAFDWKAQINGWDRSQADYDDKVNDLQIVHFKNAFHGRSGYTISTTNTDPTKTELFPKFNWTRINPPSLRFPITDEVIKEVERAEWVAIKTIENACRSGNGNSVAAIMIEPISGEGGDLHYTAEFFGKLREVADKYHALLIFDEVQSGMGSTGKWWAYQHHGIAPDIIVFAKKMQVGGIMVSNRIDTIKDNVFKKSSRINSTFGGHIVDFVRATHILETIVNDNLLDNATNRGKQLLDGLERLQEEFPFISNARGSGLMCALTVSNPAMRNEIIDRAFDRQMIILPCGQSSIRFRPALTVREEDIAEGLQRLRKVLEGIK